MNDEKINKLIKRDSELVDYFIKVVKEDNWTKEDTYLYKYYKKICDGEIIVGIELKTELENLLEDMDNPRYEYNPKSAIIRMMYMEYKIKLTKAPYYGKPMILMLWQKAFIECTYSFKMADTGRDRFKTVVLLIGRKNTKSETCSALGLTEAVVGDSGSDIVCASNDDNQSSILYDAIDTMRLLMDPNETSTHKNQSFIKVLHNGSKIFKLSERTRRKEGRNIDKAYVDEVHEMQDNSLVKPLEQSQSLKVNPKLMIISTEGFVYDGYLDNLLIDCRKVINKEDTGISAERMLPWLYTQDSQQEIFQDERSWMKSNPTLGIVKPYEYLREQVDKAKKNKQDRAYVLSKDFNFKMSNTEAWLLPEEYENISTFDLERFRNSICLGAADLAETTDLTCAKILLMLKNDPVKYIYTMYFIPESKLLVENDSGANYKEWARQGLIQISKGNDTDLTEVADWFYKLRKDYNIRLFHGGYDQKFSKEFIKRANAYGMDWEIVNQKKETLTNPMRLVEADLKSKLINYNNNPVDKWCFANTCMDIDKTGTWIKPAKIANQPTRKIDGTAALINLYEIYRRYRSEFMIGVNARKEVS